MTDEVEAFKAYVATIPSDGDERQIAAMLGEAKSLLANAGFSLPCIRQAASQNRLLSETLVKINKVSIARGIAILKDLGLYKPVRQLDDRRF